MGGGVRLGKRHGEDVSDQEKGGGRKRKHGEMQKKYKAERQCGEAVCSGVVCVVGPT